jgi:hypothetical protein
MLIGMASAEIFFDKGANEMSEAQKRLNEIEAEEKRLAEEKKKILEESKEADLELVRKLCKQHGFTATKLRGYLATKGTRKPKDEDSPQKPAAKKTTKKTATKK